jgi:hypothetical protein
VNDPQSQDRLILSEPIIDQTAQTTSQLFGDGIDGVTYLLVATVDLDDGRILMKRASLTCLAQPLLEPPLPPGAVAFDYHRFITLFPEFKEVSPQQAQMYWSMACEIVRNDGSSPVQDLCEREEILMLLTAHICALLGGPNGGGGFGPQITSTLTSKSVNGVSLSGGGLAGGVNGTQAWYHLTRYGQLAWMKLRAYRLFHYVPGGQRTMTNPFSSWPWVVGWHPAGCGQWSGSGRRWFLSILPIVTGPTGPAGPPGDPGKDGKGGVVDQVSITGEGTDADPWMVRDVNAGGFPNNGATGAAGGRGGRGASGPRDDEF